MSYFTMFQKEKMEEKMKEKKNRNKKNRLAALPFYKLIYEVAETLLLLSRG